LSFETPRRQVWYRPAGYCKTDIAPGPITRMVVLASRLKTQVLAIRAMVPRERPLVILADHGFIRARGGITSNGGNALQELIVP
jgi:hypothetical protein